MRLILLSRNGGYLIDRCNNYADQLLENGSVGLLFQKSFNEKMTPSSFERVSSHC